MLFLPCSFETVSSPVVPVCTPTRRSFRSSKRVTFESPLTAISWWASKYGALKSIDCLRSSVIVIDETSRSRSPCLSALKMPSHGVLTNFTSRPALCATARTMSMSKPTISPFSFCDSNGA